VSFELSHWIRRRQIERAATILPEKLSSNRTLANRLRYHSWITSEVLEIFGIFATKLWKLQMEKFYTNSLLRFCTRRLKLKNIDLDEVFLKTETNILTFLNKVCRRPALVF
jgi:hypothetical protein